MIRIPSESNWLGDCRLNVPYSLNTTLNHACVSAPPPTVPSSNSLRATANPPLPARLGVGTIPLLPSLNHPSDLSPSLKRKSGYGFDDEYVDKPQKKAKLKRDASPKRKTCGRRDPQPPPNNPTGKVHMCNRGGCKQWFTRSRDLIRHWQSLKHSAPKFACKCGDKFTRPDPLKRHQRETCKILRVLLESY